ncbi:MAG: hypothetical protein QM808_16260 [Steroidobacteraceae bacterium]
MNTQSVSVIEKFMASPVAQQILAEEQEAHHRNRKELIDKITSIRADLSRSFAGFDEQIGSAEAVYFKAKKAADAAAEKLQAAAAAKMSAIQMADLQVRRLEHELTQPVAALIAEFRRVLIRTEESIRNGFVSRTLPVDPYNLNPSLRLGVVSNVSTIESALKALRSARVELDAMASSTIDVPAAVGQLRSRLISAGIELAEFPL